MTDFKKIFLDTSPIIYYLDEDKYFGEKTMNIIEMAINTKAKLITSVISCEEYLVHIYRKNIDCKRIDFYNFLADCCDQVLPINMAIADKAAQTRAEYTGFKAMDSLQLAASVTSECDMFFTNDKQLKQYNGIKCLTLDDFEL